jgi:titin
LAEGANQAEHPSPIHGNTWSTESAQLVAVDSAVATARKDAHGKQITGFKQGVSQEVSVLDNATTTTYANADGTLTARVYQYPVNYQNAQGAWVPIDNTLHVTKNGSIENGSGPARVSFSGSLAASQMVTVTEAGDSFSLAPPLQAIALAGGSIEDAVPAQPVPGSLSHGTAVTYADAWPGTNLEDVWSAEQLTQLIVLQSPPSGTGDLVYRFPLTTDGLTPRLTAAGALDLVDAAGSVVFEMPPGSMSDSSMDPRSGNSATTPVTYVLGPGGAWLDVVASGSWLRDSARDYPVTIDPSSGSTGGSDAFASTYCATCNYNAVYNSAQGDFTDWIGEYGSSTGMNWTLLDYNLAPINGVNVISATWSGYFEWTDTCAPETFWGWRATSSWNYSGVTWNSKPSYSTTDGVTGSVAANWGSACQGSRHEDSVNITPWVTDWTNGSAPNDGIVINSDGNTSAGYWMQLAAYNSQLGKQSYISVTYTTTGPVNWGFQDSAQNPSLSAQSGNQPFLGPSTASPSTIPVYVVNETPYTWQSAPTAAYSAPALVQGPNSTELAVQGPNNSLDFYWKPSGSSGWSGPSVVAGPGTTYSAPSIVRGSSNSTEIVAEGANNTLDFYWNTDGNPTWNLQVPGGAGSTYSSPNIVLAPSYPNLDVAVEGPNNSLDYYWVTIGTATWSEMTVAGAGTTYSAPTQVRGSSNSTEIVVEGAGNTLDFYWSTDGNPTWNLEVPGGAGSTYSAPTIVLNPNVNNLNVAAEGPNNSLDYYWVTIGTATWSGITVAGAGTTYSAPAMVRGANASTVITAEGASNSLDVYWAVDGSSTWGEAYPGGAGTVYSAPSMVRSSSSSTAIAAQGLANSVDYYSNVDGSGSWPSGSYEVSYHVYDPTGTTQLVPNSSGTVTPALTPFPVSVVSESGAWVNAAIPPASLTGLAAGSYLVKFDMVDPSGDWFSSYGEPTASFPILVGSPPAPSSPAGGVTITPGGGGSLQPTLQAGTCTSCTGYQFQVSTRSDFGGYVTTSPWESSPSWTVPSGTLAPGETYSWRVIGRDQYESSTSWSSVATFQTPTTPAAPTAVTATGGAGQATVSWTAPSTSGGSAITGYSIVPYLNGQAQTAVAASASGTTLTGLQNGGSYTFTVAATNAMGTGTASAPSAAVIPSTVPSAPGGVSALAGSGQVTVSWQAAASNGSAVTGYTVTTYAGGTASGTTSAGASATSAVVSGLTNGTAYTFAVTATNAMGKGAASAQTSAVTPGVAPGVSVSLSSSQPARGQTDTITAKVTPESGLGTGQATPTFVQGVAATGASATLSTAVKAGDLLVVGITTNNSGGDPVTGVSDNVNGAWTKALSEPYGNGYVELWYFAGSAAGSVKVTITGTSGALGVAEYSGVAVSSALDQVAGGSGVNTTTLRAGPTAAIGGTGELVLGIGGEPYVGSGFTVGTGFTLREQANSAYLYNTGLEDELSTSSSGQSMTMTGTTGYYGAIVAVFKAGATASSTEPVSLSIPLGGTGFDGTGGVVSVGGTSCASVAGVTCTVSASQITVSGLSVTSAGVTVTATVRALGSDSVCTKPALTASVTDAATGRGGLGSAPATICDVGLGLQQWWTLVSTALGPGGTAEVNAANGNLVVTQQDGGTLHLHGNLSLGIVRAYNSEATAQPGGEPVGTGWITSFVAAGDSLGGVALRIAADEHVGAGEAITLITDSGARVAFAPAALAAPIDVTGLGATTGPLGPLVPTTLGLGSGYTRLCVDTVYTSEAGVHASMWRYVESSTGGCTGLTASNAKVLGYVTMTTDGVRREYDASGNLLSVRDALGNRVDLSYSGGKLVKVGETGGSGRAYTLAYTTWSGGTQVNVTDPAGEVTEYQENSASELVNVLNPSGTSLHYTYGGCGGSTTQLCSAQNPNGATVTFSYQTSTLGGPAVISQVTNLLGSTTAYSYGANGAVVSAITGTEEEHFAQVDSLGRVGEVDEGSTAQGAAGIWLRTTLNEWDTAGCRQPDAGPDNDLCEILELGLDSGQTPTRETTYVYNDEGAILVQDDIDTPTNIVTTTSYLAQYVESNGTVRTFTDAIAGSGGVTSQAGPRRDASTVFVLSDQTGVLSPDGNAVTSGYASFETTYARDTNTSVGAGLPIGSTHPCSGSGDNSGLLCTQTAPSKDGSHATVTTYTYDQWGQRLTMTTPDESDGAQTGSPYTYTYYPDTSTDLSGTTHAGGWLEAVTDPTGKFVLYGYDMEGHLVRTWARDATAQAGLSLTSYPTCSSPAASTGYTQTLYATSCTAAPGLYVVSQTDALGNVTTYQLDADGNQLGVRAPRGNLSGVGYPSCPTVGTYDTCMTYNAAGEVLTVQQPVEAAKSGSPHVTNTYDAYGNRVETTDAMGGITAYSYDAVNRKVTVTVGRYAVGSGPTPTGCTTSTSTPWPSGGEVVCTTTTTYDGEDNVITVQAPTSEVSDVVGATEPVVTTYVYDAFHRVIETISPRWDGTSRTLTSAAVYDQDGNVVESCPAREFTEGSGGCHGPGSATIDYFSIYTAYNAADLPTSVTSYTATTPVSGTPAAAVTTITHDADGNVITTTNADGVTTTDSYNVLDRLVWTATPQTGSNDAVTWFGYDPSGNRTWTAQTAALSAGLPQAGATAPTTASGTRDTIVSYDADNRTLDTVVAAEDTTSTPNVCFSNFSSFGVTGTSGCPTLGATNASGGVNIHTRVGYDADGNQVAQFSADAFESSATTSNPEYMVRTDYDADDRPVTQYVPRYDTADANASPLGVTTVFSGQASQASQCPTTGSIPAAPGGVGAPQTISGVPAYASTTGLCITAVTYNAGGEIAEKLMPTAGGSWSSPAYETYTYTNDGLAAQLTSPNPSTAGGQVTTSAQYDARGNVLVSTDAEGNQTISTYSADSLLLSTTAPSSQSLSLTTGGGPSGPVADPADTTIDAYDAAGDQVSSTDGYGASTLTQYTVNGHKQSVSAPSGTVSGTSELTTYTYDAAGNMLSVTSPSGNARDATNPSGIPTTYTYSENNLLLSTVTPPGSGGASLETDDTYDGFGQRTSQHTYQVGVSGCPVGGPPSTSCDGGTVSDSYYLDGRLATGTPAEPGAGAPSDTVGTGQDIFTYDAAGNETSATNVSANATWGATDTMTYYLDGSLRSQDDGAGDAQIIANGGAVTVGHTTQLSYDGAGDFATLTIARDGTSTTNTEALAYNAAGDAVMLGITTDGGVTESRSYTQDGQLANQVQSNGDVTTYTYNPDGSVQQVWLCENQSSSACPSSGATILDWWAYSYDSDGQQVASEAALASDNTIQESGYYPDGRVATNALLSQQSSATGLWTTVNYDADGNRTVVTPAGSTATTYTYNANDTLNTTATPNGTLTDQYDSDGRLESDGCTSYEYDGFNQTVQQQTQNSPSAACGSITAGSTTTTTYDALGRTVTSDQVETQSGTTTTTFWADHYATTGNLLNLLQKETSTSGSGENDLMLLVDSSGTPSQVISTAGGIQWYTNDGQGNVGAVTGTAQNGVYDCVLKYDIYGAPIGGRSSTNPCVSGYGNAGSSLAEFGYQFAQRDPTTGDYTFGSRTYDPSKAAFTTPDSYHPGSTAEDVSIGADPLTADTYSYANADPINLKDPNGHRYTCDNTADCPSGTPTMPRASSGGGGGITQAGGGDTCTPGDCGTGSDSDSDSRSCRGADCTPDLPGEGAPPGTSGPESLTPPAAAAAGGRPTSGLPAASSLASLSPYDMAHPAHAQWTYEECLAASNCSYAQGAQQQASTCTSFWCGLSQGVLNTLTGVACTLGGPMCMQGVKDVEGWTGADQNPWLAGGCTGWCWGGQATAFVASLVGPWAGLKVAGLFESAAVATDASEGLSFTDTQVQSQLAQHGGAFGFGGANPGSEAVRLDYISRLVDHIDSPDTTMIEGTYRGAPAIHYIDPATGLNVFTTPEGGVWGAWQLSPAQIENVVLRGSLR